MILWIKNIINLNHQTSNRNKNNKVALLKLLKPMFRLKLNHFNNKKHNTNQK